MIAPKVFSSRGQLRRGAFIGLTLALLPFFVGKLFSEPAVNIDISSFLSSPEFIRISLKYLLLELGLAAILLLPELKLLLRKLCYGSFEPINLAIARIVVFAIWLNEIDRDAIIALAYLPDVLRAPTMGAQWLIEAISFQATTAQIFFNIWQIACIFAAIGFFTRTMALVAALSGFYLHTLLRITVDSQIPDLLTFIALVFAVSGPATVLSVDALSRAIFVTNSEPVNNISPKIASINSLPLIWLLVSGAFFANALALLLQYGLIWSTGMSQMRLWRWDWFIAGVEPIIRVDHWLSLLQAVGFIFIVSGLLFPIGIFLKKGLMSLVFSKVLIGFVYAATGRLCSLVLEQCALTFFNWAELLRRVGKFLWSASVYLIYDGNSRCCRRSVEIIRVLDVFSAVQFCDIRRGVPSYLNSLKLPSLNGQVALVQNQQLFTESKILPQLIYCLPFCWVFSPLLFFRNCRKVIVPDSGAEVLIECNSSWLKLFASILAFEIGKRPLVAGAGLVSIVMLHSILVSGILFEHRATQAALSAKDVHQGLSIAIDCQQEAQTVDLSPTADRLGVLYFDAIAQRVLDFGEDNVLRDRRFAEFWSWIANQQKIDCEYQAVKFFSVRSTTVPDLSNLNPVEMVLLHELSMSKVFGQRPQATQG